MFVRLYGEIVDRTGTQTMLCLTCTIISSEDLTHYGISHAKDWVSVDCGINCKAFAKFWEDLIYFQHFICLAFVFAQNT